MSIDDRITREERYHRAIHSSCLLLREERMGDADILMAAGWVPQRLGPMLCRLADEYEMVGGVLELARRYAAELSDQAAELDRAARRIRAQAQRSKSPEAKIAALQSADEVTQRAMVLRRQAESHIGTERTLMMMRLKTLPATKEEVGQLAIALANKIRLMPAGPMPVDEQEVAAWRERVRRRMDVIRKLSGQVVEAYIDDICQRCKGVKFLLQPGGKVIGCRSCHETGRRLHDIGHGADQQRFSALLLGALRDSVTQTQRSMSIALRS